MVFGSKATLCLHRLPASPATFATSPTVTGQRDGGIRHTEVGGGCLENTWNSRVILPEMIREAKIHVINLLRNVGIWSLLLMCLNDVWMIWMGCHRVSVFGILQGRYEWSGGHGLVPGTWQYRLHGLRIVWWSYILYDRVKAHKLATST